MASAYHNTERVLPMAPNAALPRSVATPPPGNKPTTFVQPPVKHKFFQWVPTDQEQLRQAEERMLKPIAGKFQQFHVNTPLCPINTIMTLHPTSNQHVVLLHGFGLGLAQWVPNWDTIAEVANVYAIDLPGFARSGRVHFNGGGQEAILYFIQTIEEWIKAMWQEQPNGVPRFILMGHSFGGYLAGKYALNYPQRIEKLILVDPFGINEGLPEPVIAERSKERTIFQKFRNTLLKGVFYQVNPLSPIRGLGPLAPKLMASKLEKKRNAWKGHTEDCAIVDYLYHCNAQPPSGETAFSKCITGLGGGFGDGFIAKFPLVHELPKLDPSIPIHIIYGLHSWIPHGAGYTVKRLREDRYDEARAIFAVASLPDSPQPAGAPPIQPVTEVYVVNDAGHHVYVENASRFNGIVREILRPTIVAPRSSKGGAEATDPAVAPTQTQMQNPTIEVECQQSEAQPGHLQEAPIPHEDADCHPCS
jgi:pimeloyl-ACP methyl ester carboxylesterase